MTSKDLKALARNVPESEVEKALCSGIRRIGGECIKWESKRMPGLPDRVILYKGRFIPVELKRERGLGRLSKAQIELFERFERQGFKVTVLYGLEEVKNFLTELALGKDRE